MNTIHFENLWENCEKISEGGSLEEMLGKITGSISELRDVYKASINSNDKRLVQAMKAKAIGRLLMSLTALSGKENIDVYAALKEQLDAMRIKETVSVSI